MVLGMLRGEFGGLPDHEELYQEAWAEVLSLRAQGKPINNLPALLRTVAWRRARDRLRNQGATAVDPTGTVLAGLADPAPEPDERAQFRLDLEAVHGVIESLEPRYAAVLKLRFDWHLEPHEIEHQLGVTAKQLEWLFAEACRLVEAQLRVSADGQSPWTRRQRSLLMACELGVATERQRARAERMLERDPVARAAFRSMRATLEQLGAAIPMPALASDDRGRSFTVIRERLGDVLAAVKEQTAALAARFSGNSSAAESVGAGAAGTAGGTVVKVALACLTAAGGAVVCVQRDVFGPPHHHRQAAPHRVKHRATAAKPSTPPPRTPLPKETPHRVFASATKRERPPSPTASSPPPSPAPAGSTEFGPGAVGSSSRPRAPAAAPTSGGGEFTP